MQSYKLSEINAYELAFGSPHKAGNGFIVPVFLVKEGNQVPLLIQTPSPADEKQDVPCNWCFCFGLKKWEAHDKTKPDNYTTGIVIQRSINPIDYQAQWLNDYRTKIVSACASHLVTIKDSVRKPTLTLTSDVLTSNQFSRLEDKNGDTILNLKMRQDGQVILTEFLSYPSMKGLPPIEMVGKRCNVKCEILIESIFIGPTITIQAKLDRACVCAPKRSAIQRRPMNVYVPTDEEIHEENEVEVPDEEEEDVTV